MKLAINKLLKKNPDKHLRLTNKELDKFIGTLYVMSLKKMSRFWMSWS